MSDSDSDTYSDYLKSRQTALQKKRLPSKVYDSDSDDDFSKISAPVQKKKREIKVVDEEDGEESFVDQSTHDQHLKSKIDEMEEQYRRQLYSRDDFEIIPSYKSSGAYDSVLTKSLKLCDEIDGEETNGRAVDDVFVASEADNNICKNQIPVTVEILDCEIAKNGRRHEVPLESNFLGVRKQLASVWQCVADEVLLTLNGIKITEKDTPKSLGLRPLQIPYPVIEAQKVAIAHREYFTLESTPDGITVKVQLQNRKRPILVQATDSTTILDIKQRVIEVLSEEQGSVPVVENMKVMFDDDYVNDADTCQALGLEEADCLDVYC